MAAGVEQMMVSIQQVADYSSEARQMSSQAESTSREGAAVIASTVTGMSGIADTVRSASQTVIARVIAVVSAAGVVGAGDGTRGVCGVLRTGLDRDRAADGAADG